MAETKEHKLVDARGLMCPMPVVRAGKEMKTLAPGEVLKVLATDRGSLADLPAWAADSGNELLESREEPDGTLAFWIRKGAG